MIRKKVKGKRGKESATFNLRFTILGWFLISSFWGLTITAPCQTTVLAAQEPPTKPAPQEGEPTIELASNLVVLNVSVKDADKNSVPNLKKSDFLVFEDGVPQEITYFSEETSPLSIVLLMDVSGSMSGPQLTEAKRAATEFVHQSQEQNEMALVAFNDEVHVAHPFTSDRKQILTGIDQLTASGGTALYDAVAKAIELMTAARNTRHILVLFSDGADVDSRLKYSKVERLVQSTDITLFAVGEYSKADRKRFMTGKKYYKEPALDVNVNPVWALRQLSDVSGGSAFFPLESEKLEPLFALIAREIQHQYGIGYDPPARSGAPKFHTIEVRVKSNGTPSPLTVRTRTGYFQ